MPYYLPGGRPRDRPNKRACLKQVFRKVREAINEGNLLMVQYVTFGGRGSRGCPRPCEGSKEQN